jgi:segregation and condensation protein B
MSKKSLIQAVLYINGSNGVDIAELRKLIKIESSDLNKEISELNDEYSKNEDSPFIIKTFGSKIYLLTKSLLKDDLGNAIAKEKKINPLNKSLMEILTIIAYNKDCTSSKIEKVRDMNPDLQLKKLLELGLIEISGHGTGPGTPNLYNVTDKFFNLVGIKNASSLPKIDFEFDTNVSDIDLFDSNRDE